MKEAFVSIVAPVYNPGEYLETFVDAASEVLARDVRYFEIIIVDDGSTTLDPARVRQLLETRGNIRVLRLSRRFGEEQAILAGLDVALGDHVVTLAPGADRPELIPRFLEAARAGADVVLGVRSSRAADPWWLRLGAGAFYAYARRVVDLELPANATHFRCLSRKAIHALAQIRRSRSRLRVFTTFVGFSPHLIAYEQVGQTTLSHSRGPFEAFGTAMAILMDNTPHPLRVVAGLGLAAAVLNLCYAAYVIVIYLVRSEVAPGWATLSLTSAAQFFALALMISVLCEYVGRLSTRMQDAPSYYLNGEETSAVMLERDRRNVVAEPEITLDVQRGRPLPP